MCVKADSWIIKMAKEYNMIEPFEEQLISRDVFSYGVSSYGYDLRIDRKIMRLKLMTEIDAKKIKTSSYREEGSDEIIIMGGETIIGKSVEYFRMPRNVIGLCFGKSSYARLGVFVNITPLEPEWEGYITMAIYNSNRSQIKIYSGEGIAQVIFVGASEECKVSYKDRKGKYQAQKDIEVTKV